MPKTHLVDVRTAAEYASGCLEGAINIEYQSIGRLALRPDVGKDDDIILYCRSGRRSAIALGLLQGAGFDKVRDFGGLEEAAARLQTERAAGMPPPSEAESAPGLRASSKDELIRSHQALLKGLEGLE